MKTLTAIIILTIATTANATGKPEFPNGHDNRVEKKDKQVKPTNPTTQSTNVTQIANVESTTKVATVSKSKSTSVAKAEGGDASIGAMSFNFITPTGSTGLSFVNHDYSGMPQQAPAMGNSYINTSNSCDSASGLGFVFPGGGVNFSSTALRMMCEGRLNSQAHKALGDEDKARKVMRVVDEYACSQDAVWAKIAREEGLCKPDTASATTETNPAFNSK